MHVNRRPMSQNTCDNFHLKPFCATEQVSLPKEHAVIKYSMNMNNENDNKRKLPPLKIPTEINLFQKDNGNNYDDLGNDDTPEYPLQEGNIFFTPREAKTEEATDKEIQVETANQGRNCFSDFLSFNEKQVQKMHKRVDVQGKNDNTDVKGQMDYEASNTTYQEHAIRPKDIPQIQIIKMQKPGEEHLSHQFSTEVSWQRHRPDINGMSKQSLSVTSKMKGHIVNQQATMDSTFHPEVETFYANKNMPTQEKLITRLINYDRQTIVAEEKTKHLSWVNISNDQANNKIATSGSKSESLQNATNSNDHAQSGNKTYNSLHHYCSSDQALLSNDAQTCFMSNRCEESPTNQQRSDKVDNSTIQTSICEPLDLSQQSTTAKKSIFSSSQCSSSQCSAGKVLQNYVSSKCCDNQSHTLKHSGPVNNVNQHSSPANFNVNTKDVTAPKIQLKTMHNTTSKHSVLPLHLYTTPSFVLSKCDCLQSQHQGNKILDERNSLNINKLHSKHLSQIASPSESNDHRCSVRTITDQCKNRSSNYVHKTTQLKSCPVIACSPQQSSLPNSEVNILTSSLLLKPSSVTTFSHVQPVVSSTYLPTNDIQSTDGKQIYYMKTQLPVQMVPSSVSLTNTKQMLNKSQDCSKLQYMSETQARNITYGSVASMPRLAPLPIKDFFTHTPRENTYSSLLMAEITSRSKRHLSLQKGIEVHPQNNNNGSTFEISSNLQRNVIIDLTEGNDDSDVVSISSKDSFDDESKSVKDNFDNESKSVKDSFDDESKSDKDGFNNISKAKFLDLTIQKKTSSAGKPSSASISKFTVNDGYKNMQQSSLSDKLTNSLIESEVNYIPANYYLHHASNTFYNYSAQQSKPISQNISEINAQSPQKNNYHGCKESLTLDKREFTYNLITGNDEKTNGKSSTSSSPEYFNEAHSSNSAKVNQYFDSFNKGLMRKNIANSNELKFVAESKNLMAEKLKNIVASRTTFRKLTSEKLITSLQTDSAERLLEKSKHQHFITNAPDTYNVKLSTHDNSTQRAAATLLELSANPLYSSYTLHPECSGEVYEKVYHIHPTIDDIKVGQEQLNNTHDKQTLEKSQTRTGRRVGRPLKYQYNSSDTADSEKSEAILSNSISSSYCTSNTAPSVRIHSVYNSDSIVNSTLSTKDLSCEHCKLSSKFSVVNKEKHFKTMNALRNVYNDSLCPHVTTTNVYIHDISSTSTDLASTKTDLKIQPTSISSIYNHTSGTQSNVYDGNTQFIQSKPTERLSSDQKSVHSLCERLSSDQTSNISLSKLKRKQEKTDLQNSKRAREMFMQEFLENPEQNSNKKISKTDNFITDINSPTFSVSSPTFDEPLHIVIGMDEISSDINSPDVEPEKNIAQNKIKYNEQKTKISPAKKTKHNNQETLISDLEDVLQELNSKKSVANVVVKTVFENGLQVLSLQSETESDTSQQSPQNGDQIVPVNKTSVKDCWIRHDKDINPSTITALKSSNVVKTSHRPKRVLTKLLSSASGKFDNCTTQLFNPGNELHDTDAVKEVEKERVVTSLLAEMIHSKSKGFVPC